MKKKCVLLTLAVMMALTSVPAMASADSPCSSDDGMVVTCEAADECFDAWDDFDLAEELSEELAFYEAILSEEEYTVLEALFDDVIALEEAERYDEADKLWEEIDVLLEAYDEQLEEAYYDDFNPDEELAFLEGIVTSEDYAKLEQLFEEAVALEEAEDFDAADQVWERVDELLEKYEDELATYEGFEDEMLETPAYYQVVNGKLVLSTNAEDYADGTVKEVSAKEEALYNQLWDRVKLIVPDNYEQMIQDFDLSSDGFGGMAASVANLDDAGKEWIFNYDPADVGDEEGVYDQRLIDETIVHEFGHILTLNHTQMMAKRMEKSPQYTTDEGTLKASSYLNAFYHQFWKDIAQAYAVDQNEGEFYDAEKLYEEKSEDFITDYAATNPAEDIAESFAFFVMDDKPENSNKANEKILFFYNYPELVKMRTEIRSNLNLD